MAAKGEDLPGPPGRKRHSYYDYVPPAKVATRSFAETYGHFDDAAAREPHVFQSFAGFINDYFKHEATDLAAFLRGPGSQEVYSLFMGISVYNGVTKSCAANLQVARINADYKSPYDPRVTLKEHLGRDFNRFFDNNLPLLYVNRQFWPVETIYVYRLLMPNPMHRIYRPPVPLIPRGRGGFGGGGRGRGFGRGRGGGRGGSAVVSGTLGGQRQDAH
ncbi:hypothetical protein AAVH_22536 [Aphelenchoides avenae]|nr:hypothetical protein AAVH_22536 [Aphelenchus avenae]